MFITDEKEANLAAEAPGITLIDCMILGNTRPEANVWS